MRHYESLEKSIESFAPFNEQEVRDKRLILEAIKSESNLLIRDNNTAHFTASAWIVNISRDKVLMAYHNIYDSWAWLGGHADGEADLKKVVTKEVREESGLDEFRFLSDEIFSVEILTVDGHEKHGEYVSSHLHYNITYLLEADDKAPIKINPDENSAVDWIRICDINVKSTEKWFVDRIYSKLCAKSKDY